jgi:hypothetical protein
MCRAIALSHKGENMLGEFIANVFSPLFLEYTRAVIHGLLQLEIALREG